MLVAYWSMTMLATISCLSKRSFAFVAPTTGRNFSRSTIARMTAAIGVDESQLVQDMLYRIRQVNQMPDEIRATLIDFQVDGIKLGKVRPKVAQMLCEVDTGKNPLFEMKHGAEKFLTLSADAGTTPDSRSKAVERVMEKLRSGGFINGWRDELFPVADSFYGEPLFLMERAAIPVLGVLEYGVHINGLVQDPTSDETKMWIARRSKTKSKFPGMLDQVVAGGQPAGLSLIENVIKECEEEAGVPEDIARAGVQAVGAVSYEHWDPYKDKISRVVLFNYDLHLPNDFQPKPVDGEVEEFFLWSMDQVKESIAVDYLDPIKPNCYVCIVDYLLRMGRISPETPGYLDILRELRSGDCR